MTKKTFATPNPNDRRIHEANCPGLIVVSPIPGRLRFVASRGETSTLPPPLVMRVTHTSGVNRLAAAFDFADGGHGYMPATA